MAKLKLALWCEPGRETADFHRELVDRWAAGALERPEVTGLILHRADPASVRAWPPFRPTTPCSTP